MAQQQEQLIGRVADLVTRLYQSTRPPLPEEWITLDLTMPQFRTIMLLLTMGPTRMSVLATHLGVSTSTATSLVDRLVEKGMVVRMEDPLDRRAVVCDLSHKGRQTGEKLWRLGRSRITEILKLLTAEQLQAVAQTMELLVNALEERGRGIPREDLPGLRAEER
ncbi:MAG: MarR family transcriptional regulator [Dehalococcoidia bacterium]